MIKFFLALAVFFSFSVNVSLFAKPNRRVAICYWGLTRSTKQVYQSHFKYLFDVLAKNNIDYDVFIHTWHTNQKQRVWNTEIDKKIDYEEYKLLNPTYYKLDDQDLFTDNLNFDNYFYKDVYDAKGTTSEGEWPPTLVLNHLCALESQKRVTEMVMETQHHYDAIIYVRPDAMLKRKVPVEKIKNIKDGDILIPNFDHNEGYNDRFAILSYKTAPLYGKRIDGIIDFRKTQGRIVSEKYVKYICDIHKLNVIFINFHFVLKRP